MPACRAVRLSAVVVALLFVLLHLPFLPGSLEDIDSVNFALALREFDVTAHQPHPPGYPVFVALGKLSSAVVRAPQDVPFAAGARALAIWSVLLGACASFALLQFFRCVEGSDRRALAALGLTVASPLYWFTAVRPMSDMPGLAVALAAQALLATGFVRQRRHAGAAGSAQAAAWQPEALAASGRMIVAGAFVAGLAIGFHAQTAWLTLPLLAIVIADRAGRGAAGALLGSIVTFSAGCLVWLVPLLATSGGVTSYLEALAWQAGDDLGGVELLATHPSLRLAAVALFNTFVQPWVALPLAIAVLAPAVAGAALMLGWSRPGLLLLAAAAGPYVLFHLLFHDPATLRYALPAVPAAAYLAVRGLDGIARRAMPILVAALVVVSLGIGLSATSSYARQGSPLQRALLDLRQLAGAVRPEPVLAMHHSFARALRGETLPIPIVLPSAPRHEWLALTGYWLEGGEAPIWFLADPWRTDLALIDPMSRRLVRSYRWPSSVISLMSGTRPAQLAWYDIQEPGWFAGEGWGLTPETAGVAGRSGAGPAEAPIEAFVRRRASPVVLMIGGRNLGARDDPDVRFNLSVDGRSLESWTASPQPGFFLKMWTFEPDALAGMGRYATLALRAEAADESRRPISAAVEQFDLQSADTVVFGFDAGWHEQEYTAATGRRWRWMSDAGVLRVHHAGRDVTLRVSGESPLRYFSGSPVVSIHAGTEPLDRFSPEADFTRTVRIPAAALERGDGRIILKTDRVFVPADRGTIGDRRRLGLRIYDVQVY